MKVCCVSRSLSIGVLLLASATYSYAQDNGPCSPFRDGVVAEEKLQEMLSAAEDGHLYRIQSSISTVGFCADTKLARVKGEFRNFQGGLSLWPDPGEKEQAMIVIKAASLDTNGSIVESMLKSKRYFDVENYPEILFVSTHIAWTSNTAAELKGDLTLHGVTRPVILQVRLTSVEKQSDGHIDKFVARAGTTINRSDFGMDELSQLVDDNVELCMEVVANRFGN
jgi:polyisoprenoid-binding protein YceI